MATALETLALARRHHQAGNLHQAEQLYRQLLAIDPHHAEVHHLLGNSLLRRGDYDAARAHYETALSFKPNDAETHCNLGLAFAAQAKLEQGVVHFREALRLNPAYAEAHNNLGSALRGQGDWDQAVDCFRRALQLRPGYAEALYNLGNAHRDRQQMDEAVACYRQALLVNPNNANVHNNLGSALWGQDKRQEAFEHFQQALRLKPNHAEAHRNLGGELQIQGKWDEALEHFLQALRHRPDFPEAHMDLSYLRLLRGEFALGWPEYEWRFRLGERAKPQAVRRRQFTEPLWDGSDLHGQTILLHAEQGLGDTLQFIRYAAMVQARGGRVLMECQPALVRLLASVKGIDQLVSHGSPLPAFDLQAPLLSLPGIFRTTVETIPATVPYLQADRGLSAYWRRRIGRAPGRRQAER